MIKKNNIKENGDSKSTMRNWETSFFGNYTAICINKLIITKICNKKEEDRIRKERKKKKNQLFCCSKNMKWMGDKLRGSDMKFRE